MVDLVDESGAQSSEDGRGMDSLAGLPEAGAGGDLGARSAGGGEEATGLRGERRGGAEAMGDRWVAGRKVRSE
jgi:hypothetical protein